MMQKSSSLTTKNNLPLEGDWYHFYTAADATEPLPHLHDIVDAAKDFFSPKVEGHRDTVAFTPVELINFETTLFNLTM